MRFYSFKMILKNFKLGFRCFRIILTQVGRSSFQFEPIFDFEILFAASIEIIC